MLGHICLSFSQFMTGYQLLGLNLGNLGKILKGSPVMNKYPMQAWICCEYLYTVACITGVGQSDTGHKLEQRTLWKRHTTHFLASPDAPFPPHYNYTGLSPILLYKVPVTELRLCSLNLDVNVCLI